MKKSNRLASLFLAMLMAFSLMAVTASAYDAGHEHDCTVCSEDEGIMPLGPVGPQGPPCVVCGGGTVGVLVGHDDAGYPIYIYKCATNHKVTR